MEGILRILLSSLLAMALSSCSLPFYLQAVGGQFELLRKRTPIDELLEDPDTDPDLKAALRRIIEIRAFANEQLDLPDNDSYTTYANLDRPYVVWNVVATEEFSVDPMRWCFPFAGCVAYRGFFDRENAEKFAGSLIEDGRDVHSSGSSAYSTLGYFSDPVLSTMLNGGEQYFAPLLFHELAHQKIYFKGDSELSEAFASVVEEYGAELWLSSRSDGRALEEYRERLNRRATFANLVATQQARLRSIFAAAVADHEKRSAKQESFEMMRTEYEAIRAEWSSGPNYDAWFGQPLNNAALAAVATYRRWSPALRARLGQVGLRQFYRDVEALSELDDFERNERLEGWMSASLSAGTSAQSR